MAAAQPSMAQLQDAWQLLYGRQRNAPTLEEALADLVRRKLLLACATARMRRRPWRERANWPARTLTTTPVVDCKRAAAGDRDD